MSIDTAPAEQKSGTQPDAGPPKARPSVARWLERYALVVVLAAVVVVFGALLPGTFLTGTNLQIMVGSQAVVAVIAFGMILPLVCGHFDISVGSVAVLSSILVASMVTDHGMPLPLAIAVALVVGAVIGIVNGILVAYTEVNSLIATIGSAFILTGLISWYTEGVSIIVDSQFLTNIGISTLFGVPRIVLVSAVVAIVIGYVLAFTPYGRRLVAIGANSSAAELVGLPVKRIVFSSFVLSALLGVVAGVLIVAQQGAGNPLTDGLTLALPALAAVFLGASAFTPGQFNVRGTIVGLLLVAVLVSGLTLAGAQPWVRNVLEGGSLIVAVAGASLFRMRRLRRATA